MDRFNQSNWQQTDGPMLAADHKDFITNIHKISESLNKQPASFVVDFEKLKDKGLNYAEWHIEKDGHPIEVSYSFIHTNDDKYLSLALSEGEHNEAGIDQELTIFDDPVKALNRLLAEYEGGQGAVIEDTTHTDFNDEILKRISDLSSRSTPDQKLDVFKLIKQIPDESKRHRLEQIFKDKIKAEKRSMTKLAKIVKRKKGYHVVSEEGKNLGGPYSSREKAEERLKQVEFFKYKGRLDFSRLVKKSWKPRPNSKITQAYINEIIEETLANIEMALHDEEQNMIEFFDGDWAALFEGAIDYAVSSIGSNVPHPGQISAEVLPKALEKILYKNVMTVGQKWGGKITDENFHNVAADLEQVINMTFEFWFENNQEEEVDEDNVEGHPLYDLLARVDKANPNTPSNELIDLYNEIKALPDDENKHTLMENFKHNTKKAFNKAMNRFSKEIWAQSTVEDFSLIDDSDLDNDKLDIDPEENQHELNQACRQKAGKITENLIQEIYQDLNLDDSDIPYKESSGQFIEIKACENWGQSWWDHLGEALLEKWIHNYTDSESGYGEDDTEMVFKDMNIEQEMMKTFAPAYATLMSKITNLPQDVIEKIRNHG